MAAPDVSAMRTRLLALKAELEAVEAAAAEGRATVELDQTRVGRLSRMDALQGQQMALATERRRQAEIVKIDAALGRIEAGDYGYCVKCDEPIDTKRLDRDPAAPLCIDCARGG
mgnify:CR=1 FL=1